MDGIGGTLKDSVYWGVMSEKCVIDTPKQFLENAEISIKEITSLLFPKEEVLKEPEDIEISPRITDTLQIHMVKLYFDNRKVCFLEFYHLATDNEPIFTNFTAKEDVAIKTMPLVKIAVDSAGKIICSTKNGSGARYIKYGMTDSVFTCKIDI